MPTTPGLGALLPPTQAIGVDGGKWAVKARADLPGKNQVSGTMKIPSAPASLSSRAPASSTGIARTFADRRTTWERRLDRLGEILAEAPENEMR